MKSHDQIALGILAPFVLFQSVGLFLWTVIGLINYAISYTPEAQSHDKCIPTIMGELYTASTTTAVDKILLKCPESPYLTNF